MIKEWAARPDYSDAVVTSFIRSAETNLSRIMRVKEMIAVVDAPLSQKRVKLPSDWRELDTVRVNSGVPLDFLDRGTFYSGQHDTYSHYTITGDCIEVGSLRDAEDGLPVEITYYAALPTLTGDTNWVLTTYYDLFLQACLVSAYNYNIEPDKATLQSQVVTALVDGANEEHIKSKVSGSRLRRGRSNMRIG